jgi:glycosyltransferase A (GT-A) superfamily protein (DUF2064 family)
MRFNRYLIKDLKVLAIGNDSPGLTNKHFEQACNGLTNNDLVLGPLQWWNLSYRCIMISF